MYCKEKGRSRGADCPEDAEGDGVGVCLSFSPSHNRWNAVGGKLHVLAQVEGVDGLDEADHAHLKQVVHALAAIGEALHHAQHQTQIAGNQLFPGGGVSGAAHLQQLARFRGPEHRQLRRVDPADLDLSLHDHTSVFRVALVFPAAGNLILRRKAAKSAQKRLDKGGAVVYIV